MTHVSVQPFLLGSGLFTVWQPYLFLYREARKDDWRSKQQAVKQDLLSQKLAAANAQEQAKMAMFHNMLPSGAKLTIPKRQ